MHLKGSFNVARAAAAHFREREAGAFVHMTSTSGLVGNFGQANYAAAKLGIVGLSKSIALDMARFHVRSNCVSPFAWSRLIGTIPIADEVQAARVEKLKGMTPAKIAPVAVFLLSDAAAQVTGQIFAVRNNEIFLMGQSRPLRSVQRSDGWTPETVAEHAHPALAAHYFPPRPEPGRLSLGPGLTSVPMTERPCASLSDMGVFTQTGQETHQIRMTLGEAGRSD